MGRRAAALLLAKLNLQKVYLIKMYVVPTILITSPLFEHNDQFLPSITVTRDENDIVNEVEDNLMSMEIFDDGEKNRTPAISESRSIFPDSLFDAARSDNVTDRNNVEDFITSRLDYINDNRSDDVQYK